MNNSLLNTNPHLKDPVQRKLAMIRNIVTSSAIEGIQIKFDELTGQLICNEDAISLKTLTFHD